MIVIDWGTTNLRAYLCHKDGTILARESSPRGIKSLNRAEYPLVLSELISSFTGQETEPVIISGMAGSKNGWIEAPYCQVPVSLAELGQGLIELPDNFPGYMVPGIKVVKSDQSSDVIRGEEIQVFGALAYLRLDSGVFCLPGTHSKWVQVSRACVTDFLTYMTGDVFQGLGQTILGCSSKDPFSSDAFVTGLNTATTSGCGLLHQLFTGRTRMLDGSLQEKDVSSFVSGLLIGHELNEAIAFVTTDDPVVVIGSDQLSEHYLMALKTRGIPAVSLGGDIATCKGIAALLACKESLP